MTVTASATLDEALRSTARGDRAAFKRVYETGAPQLFALAIRMLRRRDLAEEALQEAFVSIWSKAGRFDPQKGSAMAWMASILRNRCLDMIRARRPEDSIEDKPAWLEWRDDAPSPLEAALAGADARALRDCLAQLEEGPRNAILRVYYEGLTHAEYAARSGAALGTVKSWVRRGMVRLKGCLER